MASLIYQEDDAANVVDQWLDLKDLENDRSTAAHTAALISTNQKAGLGFQGKPSKPGDKMGSLLKKDKKRKAVDGEDDEDLSELHGVVEDLEESRVKAINPKGKAVEQLPAAKKAKTQSQPAPVKVVPAAQPSPAALVPPPSTHTDSNESSNNNGDKKKKKNRVKTRSKQKNIRRDNRPDTAKPQHLQLGARDYNGRPLTKETKAILKIPDKPKAPFNHVHKKKQHQQPQQHKEKDSSVAL